MKGSFRGTLRRRTQSSISRPPWWRARSTRQTRQTTLPAGSPEELVGQLLNIDPQRLRDLEAAVRSRGLTLAQCAEQKRRDLEYGERTAPAAAPRDPIVQALLDFRHRSATSAVTRGGPTLDFVQRSGVASPYPIEACTFCGKAASYRTAAGQPAHGVCERRALRRASRGAE